MINYYVYEAASELWDDHPSDFYKMIVPPPISSASNSSINLQTFHCKLKFHPATMFSMIHPLLRLSIYLVLKTPALAAPSSSLVSMATGLRSSLGSSCHDANAVSKLVFCVYFLCTA